MPEAPPPTNESWTDLSVYNVGDYTPGRSLPIQLLWYYTSLVFFESGWFPFSGLKTRLLRLFGARLGRGVVVKPNVRIKFPWRLEMGDHTWIGQDVWIDNISAVRIGSHTCVSQGVYFCTGSHDHRSRYFELTPDPITVGDGVWLAARCVLLAGVSVEANAVVAAGSFVAKDVAPAAIVGGVPATVLGQREAPSTGAEE
ncbi:MAG: WcaF family extracellular polysaccharide biosynthesis acetyltransferase [Planctomycetota bacterium]